jgi:PAS domain-containing protein
VFTWDLESNVLHADGALAKLFGLDAELVLRGLPLQTFIERIHSPDRPRVAEAIHHAVLAGDPYHIEYRVLGKGDLLSEVMAFGRCFRNKDGVPSQYAGIVFPVMERSTEGDPVLAHVALAHKHAVEEGRREVADALEAILEDLSRNHDLLSESKPH